MLTLRHICLTLGTILKNELMRTILKNELIGTITNNSTLTLQNFCRPPVGFSYATGHCFLIASVDNLAPTEIFIVFLITCLDILALTEILVPGKFQVQHMNFPKIYLHH